MSLSERLIYGLRRIQSAKINLPLVPHLFLIPEQHKDVIATKKSKHRKKRETVYQAAPQQIIQQIQTNKSPQAQPDLISTQYTVHSDQ